MPVCSEGGRTMQRMLERLCSQLEGWMQHDTLNKTLMSRTVRCKQMMTLWNKSAVITATGASADEHAKLNISTSRKFSRSYAETGVTVLLILRLLCIGEGGRAVSL